MAGLRSIVTHRYDPRYGAFPTICALGDAEAERVLNRLRQTARPGLRSDYLRRRRATEDWLRAEAARALGYRLDRFPIYFFLGDFRHWPDPARPASVCLPLTALPQAATTATLGDSMTVGSTKSGAVLTVPEPNALCANGSADGYDLRDRIDRPTRFIELQVWDRNALPPCTAEGDLLDDAACRDARRVTRPGRPWRNW